jgi:hypothetical protein
MKEAFLWVCYSKEHLGAEGLDYVSIQKMGEGKLGRMWIEMYYHWAIFLVLKEARG